MTRKLYFVIFLVFILAGNANADTLGQSQRFFISSQYDAQSRTGVIATLRKISNRAYFYIEDNYWNSVSQTMQNQISDQTGALAQEFDNRIYPTETQFFGSERNPGINNDTRITILLSPLVEIAGGYYDTTNEYPVPQVANSNQREMVYLNVAHLGSPAKIYPFLAHEFQHLISFNQKENLRGVTDDTWLNELRSEYAVTLMGYNDNFSGSTLERRLRAFLESPSDSLTEWKNLTADYGQITMFGEYLAERWSPKVIADTLKNNLAGISSINDALAKNGYSETFSDIFTDWLAANILNDSSIDPKFGYSRDSLKNFHVNPSRVLDNLGDNVVFAVSDSIKDWQARWYETSQFAPGQNNFLKISFSSPSLTSFRVPYIIFKNDGTVTTAVFNPTPASLVFYPGDISGNIKKVIFMPTKKDKISGFGAEETPVNLTFSLERVAFGQPPTINPQLSTDFQQSASGNPPLPATYHLPPTSLPDGSLIRARGDYKVYVIKGNWRRHIINSRIFGFYPGLGFDKVTEVEPEVLNQYQESSLIRYSGSGRVYSVDEAGARHWLNMSGEQFMASGRSWDSIFTINLLELQFYKIGQVLLN